MSRHRVVRRFGPRPRAVERMVSALVPLALLPLLALWGLAFHARALRGSFADPVGDIFAAWLAEPSAPRSLPADTDERRGGASTSPIPKETPR